jgi:uncharacterized protein YggU (UPF0235/DUF167 family)
MKINITVKTGVKIPEKITENPDGSLTIWTRAKAHDNEANEAVLKALSKHLKIARSHLNITQGRKSKSKTISID